VLDVPEKFQAMDQWCWAGVSEAILNYYEDFATLGYRRLRDRGS
jgi:hypothetical protein